MNGLQTTSEQLDYRRTCFECLETSRVLFDEHREQEAMDYIGPALRAIRLAVDVDTWGRLVREVMLRHPVRSWLHEDPLTARAFDQPRGYAGDAETLDLIYRHRSADAVVNGATHRGQLIHRATSSCALSRATQGRVARLTSLIDQFVTDGRGRVLSVACGHLRELEALTRHDGLVITGIDQDPRTVSALPVFHPSVRLHAVHASLADLIRNRINLGHYDFVYAAGLFDYLPDRLAQASLRALVRHTAIGGSVLVANIMPGYADIGYMESFMNWPLITRSVLDLQQLAINAGLPGVQMACEADEFGIYAYLGLSMNQSPIRELSAHTLNTNRN